MSAHEVGPLTCELDIFDKRESCKTASSNKSIKNLMAICNSASTKHRLQFNLLSITTARPVVTLSLMFEVTRSFTFTTVHLSQGLGRLTEIINCSKGLPNSIKTAVSHIKAPPSIHAGIL